MDRVLEKYLSREIDYNKLIYRNQQIFVKNNNLKKPTDGSIGKVIDIDDLVLVSIDGLPYFVELEYCELINE